MKQLSLFTLFIFMFVMNIHSQVVLTGTVSNEKHNPIIGAQVILSVDGKLCSFATSDISGKYEIKNVDKGKYHLNVSCVGCDAHDEDIDIESSMNKDVALKENAVQLDSVVVTGERPRVTTSTGHIYYLSKKASECGNPYKALQEIPDLISNYITQSVQAVDNKKMLILIDGARVNTGLTTIDPKRIESVEISDVVSSKYVKNGVEKILNIHLKSQNVLYTFIQSSIYHYLPIYYSSPNLNVEVGNDKLSAYVNITPTLSHAMESTYKNTTKSLNYTKQTEGWSKSYSSDLSYVAMIKYKPSNKDYFAFYFQGNNTKSHSRSHSSGTYDTTAADSTQSAVDNTFSSDNLSKNKSNNYSYTLFNKHTFNKKISLETYLLASNNYNKMNDRTSQNYPGNTWNSSNEFITKDKDISQYCDFNWELNDKFDFGAGNQTNYSRYSLSESASSNPTFHYKELTEYAYAEINGSIKKFKFMLSMGYEFIWRTSAGIKDHYTRPNINASFSYDMKKAGNVRLSFMQNTGTPQISSLNPYNTSTDSLTRSEGNPHLKPQQTYGGSFSYSRYAKGLYMGLQSDYTYITDRFEQKGYTDDKGVYVTTYENLGHYSNISFTATLSYRHKNFLAGCNATHYVQYFTNQDAKKAFSTYAYLQETADKWCFLSTINYTNYNYSPISRSRSMKPTGLLMVSYNFTPDIMLALGTYTLFGETRSKRYTYSSGYDSYSSSRSKDVHPFIIFRWTLRKNQNKKMSLDNGIIKGMDGGINLKK